MLLAGERGDPVLLLHAPAGEGGRLRARSRAEGPGGADGGVPALAPRAALARPRLRRARGGALPQQLLAASQACSRARWGRDDRPAARRGDDAACRPRRAAVWRASATAPPSRRRRCATSPRWGRRRCCTRIWWCATTRLSLYGFHCEEERDLFLMLLSVQAIGPKVALAILSMGPVARARGRDRGGRRAPLPGGARSRQAHGRAADRRVAREGRRRRRAAEAVALAAAGAGRAQSDPRVLAREGLLELGYSVAEADALLREASGESTEELIAGALRAAARRAR